MEKTDELPRYHPRLSTGSSEQNTGKMPLQATIATVLSNALQRRRKKPNPRALKLSVVTFGSCIAIINHSDAFGVVYSIPKRQGFRRHLESADDADTC